MNLHECQLLTIPSLRLWYFREDMGVNLHHWHWHLVYPFEASDERIVNKDRRGELFYYMHQQVRLEKLLSVNRDVTISLCDLACRKIQL